MPESNESAAPEALYKGADWIGVDWPSMVARRDRQLRLLHHDRDLDLKPIEIEPARDVRPAGTSVLLRKLRIENLKSLAGSHEVPLAPLTLIYGPNAAGKSTVLTSLRLLRRLLDTGRHDALAIWREQWKSEQLADMMTQQMSRVDPVEMRELETGARTSLQSWKELALSMDFQTRENAVGRVELACRSEGFLPVWHASSLGKAGGVASYRKEFKLSGLGSGSPWAFGESAMPNYEVTENGAAAEVRAFDSHLFSHPSIELQEDLFALMHFLHYLGPHRGSPADGYEPLREPFRNRVPDGLRRDLFNDIKDWGGTFSPFEYLNQMMSQLEIPYEFFPSGMFQELEYFPPEDPAYLRDSRRIWGLLDLRSGVEVKLSQVGYGVSQLLPVIDACVHARQQVICIEEPELHLHPRLQAKLGNLFATSAITFGNQLIVETHSESILLRIRRLIRAGKLLPDQVSVLYVDSLSEGDWQMEPTLYLGSVGEGASVRRLRLGERGELLDPWPTGFFDDRLRDVLGVTE